MNIRNKKITLKSIFLQSKVAISLKKQIVLEIGGE